MKPTYIFGLHAVQSLLENRVQDVEEIFILQNRNDHRIKTILSLATQHKIPVHEVSRKALMELVSEEQHQGVIARTKSLSPLKASNLTELLDELSEPPFLLILDGVQDPHNLGACLRSADAAGIHCVIAPQDRSVGLTPVVRKVSSGAAETVPFFQVSNLSRVIKQLQDRGIWFVGTDDEASMSLFETDLKGPLAIVMGAEGAGLRRLIKEYCDYLVKIPMKGSVSSLNVSVATGICLFEAVRQRGSVLNNGRSIGNGNNGKITC